VDESDVRLGGDALFADESIKELLWLDESVGRGSRGGSKDLLDGLDDVDLRRERVVPRRGRRRSIDVLLDGGVVALDPLHCLVDLLLARLLQPRQQLHQPPNHNLQILPQPILDFELDNLIHRLGRHIKRLMLVEEALDNDLVSHEVERIGSEGLMFRAAGDDAGGADAMELVLGEGCFRREDRPVEGDDSDGEERGLGADGGLGELGSVVGEVVIPDQARERERTLGQ
jgi:hypothetical protein